MERDDGDALQWIETFELAPGARERGTCCLEPGRWPGRRGDRDAGYARQTATATLKESAGCLCYRSGLPLIATSPCSASQWTRAVLIKVLMETARRLEAESSLSRNFTGI